MNTQMSRYEENLAFEWLDKVCMAVDWTQDPDCTGNDQQQIASAYINAQDTYAEKVISIVEMPRYLRDSIESPTARAMLPAIPRELL